MATDSHDLIADLTMLNQIADVLNRSVDVRSALNAALAQLVDLMEAETGWIFVCDENRQNQWAGPGFDMVAHYNLPPGIDLSDHEVWSGNCDCQALCDAGRLDKAYNQVRCSRLRKSTGNRKGLEVHASVPLRSGDQTLGILNVAGQTWDVFTPRSLALLTNVGSQIGITLERARLYDLLQEQRIHEQMVLLDLSNQLLGRPSLRDLMDFLLNEVRRLLNLDACALLLPDTEQEGLYFRAASGWKFDPVERERWLPADERSGPGVAMLTQQAVIVEDLTLSDATPWMSDWLKAEGFRGHAVIPLIVEGRAIGAMVVDDRNPRRFGADQLRLLQLLANQAAIALEKARLSQEEMQKQRFEDELEVSERIQRSMLPRQCPSLPGWGFEAAYQAAKQVGGDFYDFFAIPDQPNILGIVIADVADKGIPAALFMALSRTIIRSVTLSGRSPAKALLRANEVMLNDSDSEVFLTIFYGKLDHEIGEFTYCSAGHNPPLWYRADYDEFQLLKTKGTVLGVLPNITLHEETVYIARGDVVVFYTDGVTEALNKDDEEFGLERLKETILNVAFAPAHTILHSIVEAVTAFAGDVAQSDDFTMVVMKREDG